MIRDWLLNEDSELQAIEGARQRVEARYLEGAVSIVPDAQRDWAAQLERSLEWAELATRLTELEGASPPADEDPSLFEARVAAFAANVVEPARSKAYDGLGDGPRAQRVATQWLRASLPLRPVAVLPTAGVDRTL